jgi:hypothetical protein
VSGREGFGIRRFSGSETHIFHCVGGKKTDAKGSHWGDSDAGPDAEPDAAGASGQFFPRAARTDVSGQALEKL